MFSCLRFTGVQRGKSGKWISRAWIMGRPGSPDVWLGEWPTEELAAQAYDKLCLYRARDILACAAANVAKPALVHAMTSFE